MKGIQEACARGEVPEHLRIEPAILYFGTPVVIISSLNDDGSVNLAPMSSAWSLGHTVVWGLSGAGKTIEHLTRTGKCVLNLPSDDLWSAVERLAPLTGKDPTPAHKPAKGFRHEKNKFRAAGLTSAASELVAPPAVADCPLRFEAEVKDIRPLHDEDTGAFPLKPKSCAYTRALTSCWANDTSTQLYGDRSSTTFDTISVCGQSLARPSRRKRKRRTGCVGRHSDESDPSVTSA
jgi:flavin reductase (DIM6/NTAB) family NADH-FMN oxidoreductase RutF